MQSRHANSSEEPFFNHGVAAPCEEFADFADMARQLGFTRARVTLFDLPPPRTGRPGRPAEKGKALSKLESRARRAREISSAI